MPRTKRPVTKPRSRKSEPAMPAILRNVPSGYNWGWYSREDARMHLQVVDKEHDYLNYKVWLESHEKRVFEPEGVIPTKILNKLKAEVTLRRISIEMYWTDLMIKKGWLKHVLKGNEVTLLAYSGTAQKFERTIDLTPHLAPDELAKLKPEDVGLNSEFAVVEIWPQQHESRRPFILIPPILWKD